MHENTEIEEVGIPELLQRYHITADDNSHGVVYNNCMVTVHNTSTSSLYDVRPDWRKPIRLKFSMLVICIKGNAHIRYDARECHIQSNTIFVCKPGSILHFIDGQMDQASFICSGEAPEGTLSLSLQKLLPHYTELEALTALKLVPQDIKKLNAMIGLLHDAIMADSSLLFYHEAVKSQMAAVTFSFLNTYCKELSQKGTFQRTSHYRQQDYVRQFMSLLSLHFRQQRRVSFYSDQMHITPKYLGTIVTQQTGRTVSEWIDHFVVSEAKVLLGNSSLTIQEITYKLNFPNQSFFCKYFKAHTGKTPSGFRREHL